MKRYALMFFVCSGAGLAWGNAIGKLLLWLVEVIG